MSDDDAFLRSIRQNPADHLRRLVYADWLDERGDPRGEYLRLACRLSELRDSIDPTWRQAVRGNELRVDDLRLDSGRSVSLVTLRQFSVYEGLLEGLPTREMNAQIIDRLVAEEQARPFASAPLLLTPEQRPLEGYHDRPYPFGKPASLPQIACVGRFRSLRPARNPSDDCSELVVIWFQNDFAPPIGPEVWPHFRAIDWDRHATDYSW